MKYSLFLILSLPVLTVACKTANREPLHLILFGYDSLAVYYGNSKDMNNLSYGKLTDSLFVQAMLTTAKERRPQMVLMKPCDGGSVFKNWEVLDTLFRKNGFENRKLDTLDETEQAFFKTNSIIPFLAESAAEPLRLFLPKGDGNKPYNPTGKETVVLLLNNDSVYLYTGTKLHEGTMQTYKQLAMYVKAKRSAASMYVIIKPGKKSSYKNTVDILDVMAAGKVKNYSLEEPTAAEEEMINKLSNQ